MLSKGGVGMATVLVGLSVGKFGASPDRFSTGVDVIVGALEPRVCVRLFSMAKGLGR